MTGLWTLAQAADALGATLHGDGALVPAALSMDTRTIQPGACFAALRAERDGHAFAAAAGGKGAPALLVDPRLALPVPHPPMRSRTVWLLG